MIPHTTKCVYTVVEYVGTKNETIVSGPHLSFAKCDRFLLNNYDQDKVDELGVAILRNGSLDY